MMEALTYKEAVELLDRAVAERGEDYVYPDEERTWVEDCRYFFDGHPSCIIGHVLAYKGIGAEQARDCEGTDAGVVISKFFEPETDVKLLFLRAQGMQDRRYPWGHAVFSAKRSVEDKEY